MTEPEITAPISRRAAIAEVVIAVVLLGGWLAVVRLSGLGAWLEGAVGPFWLAVVVALQGVPTLLVVAALLRWHREPLANIGLGRAPVLLSVFRGLLAVGGCYLAQPIVVGLYLAVTGQSPADLAAQKAGWIGAFAELSAALLFPVAAFVGVYEEVLFRGFLQSRLMIAAQATPDGRRSRAAAVVVLSALIFSVGHAYQGPLGVLQTYVVGLVLGASAYLSRSLWPVILAHVTIDTIGLATAKYLGPTLKALVEQW